MLWCRNCIALTRNGKNASGSFNRYVFVPWSYVNRVFIVPFRGVDQGTARGGKQS